MATDTVQQGNQIAQSPHVGDQLGDVGTTQAHRQQSPDLDRVENATERRSKPSSGWRKLVFRVKFVSNLFYTLAVFFFAVVSIIFSTTRGDEQGQSSDETTDSTLPLESAEQQPGSDRRGLSSRLSTEKIVRLLRLIVRVVLPFLIPYLWMLLLAAIDASTTNDPEACAAREIDGALVGNADFYGLGIRIGIYLQWVAAILVNRTLPSARKFVVSSYLFFHFGVFAAMCLLLRPASCTFASEHVLVLQLLWTGGALVLVPSAERGTEFDPASEYITIDLITVTMTITTFVISSWFYIGSGWDSAKHILSTSDCSGALTQDRNRIGLIRAVLIGVQFASLFETCVRTHRRYMLSELGDWAWKTSAVLSTAGYVWVINFMSQGVVFWIGVLGAFDFKPTGEDQQSLLDDGEEDDEAKFSRSVYSFIHGLKDFLLKWFRLFRQFMILIISVSTIELTILLNNISGVHSLDSTGQTMPLAIGIVTVLSVVYLWVKEYLIKTGHMDVSRTRPAIVQQSIGMSTSTGVWR